LGRLMTIMHGSGHQRTKCMHQVCLSAQPIAPVPRASLCFACASISGRSTLPGTEKDLSATDHERVVSPERHCKGVEQAVRVAVPKCRFRAIQKERQYRWDGVFLIAIFLDSRRLTGVSDQPDQVRSDYRRSRLPKLNPVGQQMRTMFFRRIAGRATLSPI
jgi:hypothetical protein